MSDPRHDALRDLFGSSPYLRDHLPTGPMTAAESAEFQADFIRACEGNEIHEVRSGIPIVDDRFSEPEYEREVDLRMADLIAECMAVHPDLDLSDPKTLRLLRAVYVLGTMDDTLHEYCLSQTVYTRAQEARSNADAQYQANRKDDDT